MTWILTHSGQEHHLAGFAHVIDAKTPVSINDIAHSLSLINRFTGHTFRPYSVAEHSLHVADLARRDGAGCIVQIAALLHDAHEAYCGDVSAPAKIAVDSIGQRYSGGQHIFAWHEFEHTLAARVHRHFRLETVFHSGQDKLRKWDLIALATERRDLTAYDPAQHLPWAVLGDGTDHAIQPDPEHHINAEQDANWRDIRQQFLERFDVLTAQVGLWQRRQNTQTPSTTTLEESTPS